MLFDVVARQLGYSWLPSQQEALLYDLIDEGIAFLARYDPDVTLESAETDHFVRSLLIEYVRYSLANARDEFKTNYRAEILSLSDRGRVHRARNNADTEADNSDI